MQVGPRHFKGLPTRNKKNWAERGSSGNNNWNLLDSTLRVPFINSAGWAQEPSPVSTSCLKRITDHSQWLALGNLSQA